MPQHIATGEGLARCGHYLEVIDIDLPSPGVISLVAQDQADTTINGVLHHQYGVDRAIINESYPLELLAEICRKLGRTAVVYFLLIDAREDIN